MPQRQHTAHASWGLQK